MDVGRQNSWYAANILKRPLNPPGDFANLMNVSSIILLTALSAPGMSEYVTAMAPLVKRPVAKIYSGINYMVISMKCVSPQIRKPCDVCKE